MNNLVVGKNSKICRVLGFLKGVEFVSHSDLPIDESFDVVYIFSYSLREEDNIRLLAKVASLDCNDVVYVSSITASLADKHKYKYPCAKRRCEIIAERNGFRVVRIGMVIETLSSKPGSGDFLITPIEDIKTMLITGNYYCGTPQLRSFGRKPAKLQFYYGNLLDALGPASILFRPIDLILKLAGHSWGGYNSIIVSRYRRDS